MVATVIRSEVTKRAKATSAASPALPTAFRASTTRRSAAPSTARIANPETGLLDEPIRPAM